MSATRSSRSRVKITCPVDSNSRFSQSVQTLNPDVLEVNLGALGLEGDAALLELTVLPLVHLLAVNNQGDVSPFAGDLVLVPLPKGLFDRAVLVEAEVVPPLLVLGVLAGLIDLELR